MLPQLYIFQAVEFEICPGPSFSYFVFVSTKLSTFNSNCGRLPIILIVIIIIIIIIIVCRIWYLLDNLRYSISWKNFVLVAWLQTLY
jgi:hypothetical protein